MGVQASAKGRCGCIYHDERCPTLGCVSCRFERDPYDQSYKFITKNENNILSSTGILICDLSRQVLGHSEKYGRNSPSDTHDTIEITVQALGARAYFLRNFPSMDSR